MCVVFPFSLFCSARDTVQYWHKVWGGDKNDTPATNTGYDSSLIPEIATRNSTLGHHGRKKDGNCSSNVISLFFYLRDLLYIYANASI